MTDLKSWLNYLETLNPNKIELGLERINEVFKRFNISKIAPKVIVVAGTNGKGSTINYLESILSSANYSVAKYTSPHIFSFTERIVINEQQVSQIKLVDAFNQVKKYQQDTVLSYFEFTTLAAFICIYNANVDVALLEIGLGGRLDAVNIVTRDINLLTNVDLDHTDWLGDTRDEIAKEKLAITKKNVPFYCAETNLTESMIELLNSSATESKCIARDFKFKKNQFIDSETKFIIKNMPKLLHQQANLALALVAINQLNYLGFKINEHQINVGIGKAFVFARQSIINLNNTTILVDAAHNIASVKALSNCLKLQKYNCCHAVFSVSEDKDVDAMLLEVKDNIDIWYVAPYKNVRSIKKSKLKSVFIKNSLKYQLYETIKESFKSAMATYKEGDLIVVFGSFFVIDELKEDILIEN